MPHRCVVGGCSNVRKDGVSLHKWPEDANVAKLWTKAVKNTRSDFFNPTTSHICSAHFTVDSFEEQSVIAKSLGLKMKNILKPNAVPTIFTSGPPDKKKQRRVEVEDISFPDAGAGPSKHVEKPLRGAYRKREAARILAEHEKKELQSTSGEGNEGLKSAENAEEILSAAVDVATQTRSSGKNVSVQFRSSQTARGCQASIARRDQGTQCTLLRDFMMTSTPVQSDDELSDYEEEMEVDDDPSYVPDPEDIADDDDDDMDFDDFDDRLYEESPKNAPPHRQNLFLVAESSLLALFQFCPVCRSECERTVDSRFGTRITVTQKCFSCAFFRSWDSQPSVGDIPIGNIMMSSSILFGGGSPAKVLRILKHMNVPAIGYSTFMTHQRKYLHTAVQRTYKNQQSALLNEIKAEGKELILGGDGRCDSPGHSAKYGTYSLIDVEQNKIIDSQLVQSNEVKNSANMEKEGLARSLAFVTGEGLSVNTLITDRHVQIRKYMRVSWSGIKHRLDGWHLGKGTGKKIDAIAKKKDCDVVKKWKKSVVNHMFWCASSTDDDDPDLKEAKWLSITNHLMDRHTGHDNPLFTQCAHGRLRGRERKKKWLKPGTPPYENLTDLLTKGSLLKDIRQMSGEHATSSLEAFHSVYNHFATKMLAFSYHGMTSRLQIAILHFNENSDREQATTQDGKEQFNIAFPKYKKGEHTVKKILVKCTYGYVADLKERVMQILQGNESSVLERGAAPRSLSSNYDRPDKQAAVNELKSRFNK